MYKPALTAASIFALLGVAIGAMGAHALKSVLSSDMLNAYETAVKYQFYHSFALCFAGVVYFAFPSAWIRRATWAFTAGILLFSGSIYILVYLKTVSSMGLGGFGLLTPIGGLCFILGWIFLLVGIHSEKQKKHRDKNPG